MAYTTEVAVILAVNALGLVVFAGLVLATPKLASKLSSPQWVALHGLPAICNLLAIVATACQLFLFGRTESGCFALHRTAGTCYWIMQVLMRIYFMLRVILIHGTASRAAKRVDFAILGFLCVYFPVVVTWFNLDTWTFLLPGVGVCMIGFSEAYVMHMMIVPTALDVLINWRFLTYIVLANMGGGTRNNEGNKRIGRLIKITALFFLFQTIFVIVFGLMLFDAIPVPPGFQTVVFALELSVNAGSTIWPMIVVQCMKRVVQWHTTAGSNTEEETTAVKTLDAGSKMQQTASQAPQISDRSRLAKTGEDV